MKNTHYNRDSFKTIFTVFHPRWQKKTVMIVTNEHDDTFFLVLRSEMLDFCTNTIYESENDLFGELSSTGVFDRTLRERVP